MSILLFILALLLFSGLILAHEWGHFIFARRNGVKVEEFALFFGPALYRHKTKAGWTFRINLFPLGGYVKLFGEHDTDTEKGSFGAASLWAKTKIMGAGVVINIILGAILLMITAWVGMPQLVPNQYTVKSDTKVVRSEVILSYIEPGSPAAKAGLRAEDNVTAIGAAQIKSPDALKAATKRYGGQKVTINYERQGKERSTQATLLTKAAVDASLKTNNPKGQLGVIPTAYTLQRSTWSAPVVAVGLTGQFTVLTFQGLGHALAGVGSIIAGGVTGNSTARTNGQTTASGQVSGTVGIVVILKDGSLLGYQFILFVMAVISLTLGIMNLLPIPALDGGRLWLTLFMRGILKRPISPRREELINAGGILFLLALFALITVVDIKRFF